MIDIDIERSKLKACTTHEDLFEYINHLVELYRLSKDDTVSTLVDEAIEENNLCPDCLCECIVKTYREDRGEYQGERCYETLTYNYCPNCGREYY